MHVFVNCLRLEKGRGKITHRKAVFNFLRRIRWAVQSVIGFLKKLVAGILRFLYRNKKIVLLIAVVVLITVVFNFLIGAFFFGNNDGTNGEDDRTISTTGEISVKGLVIYGGDTEAEGNKVYIDWGELTLGASKNASFYVLSNSNVNVTLGLNVTDWLPTGIDDYIKISWNYDGTVLTPDRRPLLVTVNLNVASSKEFIDFLVDNSVTSFGFDMTVYASG